MAHTTSLRQLSRRQFLKASRSVLAAGAVAPYFVSSRVLAAADRPGANDRVQVGYIGYGRRAEQLTLTKDAVRVAVADCNRARAEAAAARDRCAAYQDYRQLLDRQDVDAVIVASPDHWHTLHCIHACQAGKDVYCEKPMTLTIREGRQLVQAVRKYARVFQTGSQQRSMAPNRMACALVREGRLGRVQQVIGHNYPSPWDCKLPAQPVPAGLDWDAWCGQVEPVAYHADLYTPRANPGWISFRSFSGGEMTGWGAHGLDQIQWALGMDESGPVEIWTEGAAFDPPTYTQPESRDRGDRMCGAPIVRLRYANEAHVTLQDAALGGGAAFICERGKITIDRGWVQVEPTELQQELVPDAALLRGDSEQHMQNWIDCIKSRERPVADVEIGHRSTTVCHLGNLARWLGRPLRWDPQAERFLDDDPANQLLQRPQRAPYTIPEVV